MSFQKWYNETPYIEKFPNETEKQFARRVMAKAWSAAEEDISDKYVRFFFERLICSIWAFIWQRWIEEGDRVVKVKGWRTALVDKKRSGRTIE